MVDVVEFSGDQNGERKCAFGSHIQHEIVSAQKKNISRKNFELDVPEKNLV